MVNGTVKLPVRALTSVTIESMGDHASKPGHIDIVDWTAGIWTRYRLWTA